MKKSLRVLLVLGIILALIITAAIVVWVNKPVKISMYGESKVVKIVDAKAALDEIYNNSTNGNFHVIENGETILTINLNTTMHPTYDENAINDIKKSNIFSYYQKVFEEKSIYTWELNKSIKALREEVRPLNATRIPSTNAAIVSTKKGFKLEPEVYGNKIYVNELAAIITETVGKNEMSVDLKNEDVLKNHEVYPLPKIKEADIEKAYNKLTKLYKCSITYTSGTVFNWKTIKDYVTIGKKHVAFDDSIVTEFVSKLDSYYTSIGSTRSIKTHTGQVIQVSGGTYGNVMDSASEIAYLKKALRKGSKKVDRVPNCSERSVYGDGVSNLGDTYIEINIAEQHLWFYKGGSLLMQSDVVTGTRGSHDTPTGVYYLSEKVPGEYLIGDDYKTWVDRWMRLTNSGVGLHDANWRSSFGGSIYTYSGSHGCVNLPPTFAKALYDEVPICCPVVVYNQVVSAPAQSNDDADDDDADEEDDSEETEESEESEEE
ncbi:MAG: L,D-transpeptidase family protein [Lachnospiraceae bacterium]|nr:L,D-transpeptidase family protein [Lachnospiraceae bacterium]